MGKRPCCTDRAGRAGLRARHGLRTPDAIHLASVIEVGAKAFVTAGRRLPKMKEIAVLLMAPDR